MSRLFDSVSAELVTESGNDFSGERLVLSRKDVEIKVIFFGCMKNLESFTLRLKHTIFNGIMHHFDEMA
jgi:hypothetical protein